MPHGESTFFRIVILGGLIGLAQLLVSTTPITLRAFVGRMIMGSAVSLTAGAALIHFKEIDELAIIGIASALGIAGHTAVEALIKRFLRNVKKDPQ
ncbi:holin [Serratia fonticola]|uniref:holin n=1 Tax=Serratia fonticola TaxID=47917 RepID=UPI0015C666FE|nr:holin [Serratia fonticola]NXZ86290.1 holin [Serratia fonticola]